MSSPLPSSVKTSSLLSSNTIKSPSPVPPQQQQQTNKNLYASSASPPASATTTSIILDDSTLANDITSWLKRAQVATTKRDEAITKVSRLVASGDQSASDLEDSVASIVHQQLPNLVPSIASVAEQVSQSARVAEGSYKKATTIDRSLGRVNEALEITRAVLKMRSSLESMQAALDKGDIEGASAAVAEYDETSRKLKGRESMLMQYASDTTPSKQDSDADKDNKNNLETQSISSDSSTSISMTSDSLDSSSFVNVSVNKKDQGAFVQDTRQKVHDAAMTQLEKATNSESLDEKTLRSCVTVLARLSFVEDAEKTFSEFMAKKNVAELNKIADKKKIEEARVMRGASHLELVARLLDHTVGCLEEQEEFVNEYLGGKMKNFMLTLHNKSAKLCVDVLKDFLDQRKLSSNNHDQNHKNHNNNKDPATIDQQLEDLTRLLVCCSTYFQYLIDKLCEEDPKLTEKAARQLVRTENELASNVEDLMAIFVPLQIDYFDSAYSVAVADTFSTLNLFERVFTRRMGMDGGSSSSGGDSGSGNTNHNSNSSSSTNNPLQQTGFLQSMAAALGAKNLGSGDGGDQQQQKFSFSTRDEEQAAMSHFINSSDGTLILPEIDVVQDIFYVCRIAIHRVMGTKASAIASSALIVINNLISDKLLTDAKRNIEMNLANLSSPTARSSQKIFNLILALIWTGALSAISKDAKNLAEETGKLSEKFFKDNQDDLVRFSEQRLDFVQTATMTDDTIDHVCKTIGNEVFKLCDGIRGDVKGVSFILDHHKQQQQQQQQQQSSSSSSTNVSIEWVEPATERFAAMLSNVTLPIAPWSDTIRCAVVSSFLDCITIELEQAIWTKRFDLAGALKFDQDLRQLRNFFSTDIDVDVPVREKFRRLVAMTSVLLSERKADIQQQQQQSSNVLNSSDVSNLIKLRVDPPMN